MTFQMAGLLALIFGVALAEPFRPGAPSGEGGRTICGSNDMVAVAGQSSEILAMAAPIGLLEGPGFLCSGTLIGANLFLTARHCEASCADLKARFNFLSSNRSPGRPNTFSCSEIVDQGGDPYNEDFMILKLEGSPGVEWGWYDLSDRPLLAGEKLMMLHHPQGLPMKMSLKNCSYRKEVGGLLNHSCDTLPGSSGSAILVPNLEEPEKSRIVGVHTLGGCNASETSFNSGPSIRYLATINKTIRDLVK